MVGLRTMRGADDAAAYQQLLVEVVEEVAALVAEPVHRHDRGVEALRAPFSSPAWKRSQVVDEIRRLAAERHGAVRAAPHLLDEVAAPGAAENGQPVADRSGHRRRPCW